MGSLYLTFFTSITRQNTGHFGDFLSSQFLGVVLKKTNLTQQKQTKIQEQIVHAKQKIQNAKPKQMHKSKRKPKPTIIFRNCSYGCAYHCAQLSYTTQHKTVPIIFPRTLRTIMIAQILSTGRSEVKHVNDVLVLVQCLAAADQSDLILSSTSRSVHASIYCN